MSKSLLSASSFDDFVGFPVILPSYTEENSDVNDVDVALMQCVAKGDHAAFETLVKKHQKPLLNFFVRMGAYSDSEDLVQNTFIRLYRYRERYQPTAKFTTFLYVLAYRVWADLGRKTQRNERLSASLQTEVETTHQHAAESSLPAIDVEAALDKLSEKLRHVIVLNFYQGLRYQEIADVLNVPLGTVKSRINLAINALREQFHEAQNKPANERQ
jgi:RNA polymerase sigma-70 factor (ECF subfamily)